MPFLTLKNLRATYVRGVLRRGRQSRPSMFLNVEPTNICNLACPVCPHGASGDAARGRPRGYMQMETLAEIFAQCAGRTKRIALYMHGEPFLHPQIADMIEAAAAAGIRVDLSSNGLAIVSETWSRVLAARPHRLMLSMDLLSAESYRFFRGADRHADACRKLKALAHLAAEQGMDRVTELRTMYGGESAREIREFLERWTGVPGIGSIQVTHAFPWPGMLDPEILRHRLDGSPSACCAQIWSPLSVYWDGRVTQCSYDYDGLGVIGDVREHTLDEMRNSPAACRFRRMHIFGRAARSPLCAHCLLPRFRTSFIRVDPGAYRKLDDQARDRLVDDISNLGGPQCAASRWKAM